MHWKEKAQDCAETASSEKILGLLVNKPGRLFILTKKVFKMDEIEEGEAHNLEYQRIEEVFEDKDSNIFDTILFNGPIDSVKTKLKLLKYKGT